MFPFALLLAAFILLHAPGLRHWPGGPRPADKAAGALGLVLLFTGALHFARPTPFLQMVPPFLPWPEVVVCASGVAECLVALGLLIPGSRKVSGWAAAALFVAVWPANIHVALSGTYPGGFPQSALYQWIRVPFQLLYIGWAAWAALGHLPGLRLRRLIVARYYDRFTSRHEAWLAPQRKALLEHAGGTVLEIGPGTGANFPYLSDDVRWIGIEPNTYMHRPLRARAQAYGIVAEIRPVSVEGMQVEDESVDTVICTHTLCSVNDPAGILQEIKRVLKSGGSFIFLEHVAAPSGTWRRRWQRLLRPVWQFHADGCRPDRELAAVIRGAGFARLDLDVSQAPRSAAPGFLSPHIAGTAIK